MRTSKTLIRLGGCPGWSESSLGAHSFCRFSHVAAKFLCMNGTLLCLLLSGGQLRSLSGGQSRSLSGGQSRSLSGGQLRSLSGGQLRSLSDGQLSSLSGGQLRSLGRFLPFPDLLAQPFAMMFPFPLALMGGLYLDDLHQKPDGVTYIIGGKFLTRVERPTNFWLIIFWKWRNSNSPCWFCHTQIY